MILIVIFLKDSCLAKYTMGHCLIGKYNQKEKQTHMPGLISKKVSMMYEKENREIEQIFYMPFWLIWLSSPSPVVKKSIEDAGFSLFRDRGLSSSTT